MEQYIEFAGNHIWLFAAFAVILAALAWNLINDPSGKFNIDPVEATLKINREDALVLDTRSMKEFSDGHIINAENVPLNTLGNQLQKLEKHKQHPIIAVCRSGSRSTAACTTLRKAGFEQVYNLRGGMLAWENAGQPVKRK